MIKTSAPQCETLGLIYSVGHIVIDVLSFMSIVDDSYEAQKGKRSTKSNEDQGSKGRAHCRSVFGIDGYIEKSINAHEKVRSLSSRLIKKNDGVDCLI
jgi:hypothetical protein